MQEEIIRALEQRRAPIRIRWEALLRIEKVTTPLANPDTLVFGLDQSLDEIFARLRQPALPASCAKPIHADETNPWYAYFRAGEQALLETLVLTQAEMPALDPAARDSDFSELKQVIHYLTQREVAAWIAICKTAGRSGRNPCGKATTGAHPASL